MNRELRDGSIPYKKINGFEKIPFARIGLLQAEFIPLFFYWDFVFGPVKERRVWLASLATFHIQRKKKKL